MPSYSTSCNFYSTFINQPFYYALSNSIKNLEVERLRKEGAAYMERGRNFTRHILVLHLKNRHNTDHRLYT